MIKFDETHGLFDEKIEDFQPQVTEIHKSIREKTGKGNDFLDGLTGLIRMTKKNSIECLN